MDSPYHTCDAFNGKTIVPTDPGFIRASVNTLLIASIVCNREPAEVVKEIMEYQIADLGTCPLAIYEGKDVSHCLSQRNYPARIIERALYDTADCSDNCSDSDPWHNPFGEAVLSPGLKFPGSDEVSPVP